MRQYRNCLAHLSLPMQIRQALSARTQSCRSTTSNDCTGTNLHAFTLLFRLGISTMCPLTLYHLPTDKWRQLLAGAMLIISLLGSLQNLLFLALLWKKLVPATQTHRIYGLLATFDFLTSFVVAPIHLVQALIPELLQNCYLDTVRVQLSAILSSLSSYTICLVSYDRYLLVKYPMNSEILPNHFYSAVLGLTAISAFVPLIRFVQHPIALKIYSSFVLLNGTIICVTLVTASSES